MNHKNELSPIEKQSIIIYQPEPASSPEVSPPKESPWKLITGAIEWIIIIAIFLGLIYLTFKLIARAISPSPVSVCEVCQRRLEQDEVHIHCEKCHRLLAEGEECPICRTKEIEKSSCPKCKTLLSPDGKCPKCDKPVALLPKSIALGEKFSLTVSSYALPAPSVEIRPWFKMYGYNSNIQSKTPFFSKSTYTGRLQDAFPVKSSYAVQLTEGSTYLWFVDNLKGKNSDLVTPTTANGVSTNSIIVKQKKFGLKPFWVTISPGNQIAMKYLRREGNIWHFQLTHYKITNPNYTYHLTFSLETDKVRRTIGTQTSRTHANATSMNPIVLTNNPSGKSTLDISLDSPDHGHSNIKFTISPTEIARTLNQKMKENPSQNSWIIPIKNEEYTVILCYHVIKK